MKLIVPVITYNARLQISAGHWTFVTSHAKTFLAKFAWTAAFAASSRVTHGLWNRSHDWSERSNDCRILWNEWAHELNGLKKSLNEWASRLNGWKIFSQKSWTAGEWTTNLVNKGTVDSAYTVKINNHYQSLYRNRFGNNSNIERSISNLKSKSNIS